MANDWHYTQNGQPAPVPVSTADLKQLAAAGKLQPADLVWQEGMPGWVPASSIKGLFGGSRSAELPATTSPADSGREAVKPREKEKPKEPVKKKTAARDEAGGDTTALASSSVILEMHPALVFLLSLATAGVFGVLYALKASSTLAKQYDKRAVDAGNRPLGRYQHPVRVLILSAITLGFYFPFWASRALRECNAYANRPGLGGRLEFCLMLVIPFYAYFVVGFRLAPRVRQVQAKAGIPADEQLNPLAPLLAGGFATLFLFIVSASVTALAFEFLAGLFGWTLLFILGRVYLGALALFPGLAGWIAGMACQEAMNEAWQRAA